MNLGAFRFGCFALGIVLATVATGCARPGSDRSGALASSVESAERTVFNDTALYRQHCAQADSGLTLATGRCTPRDQRVRVP